MSVRDCGYYDDVEVLRCELEGLAAQARADALDTESFSQALARRLEHGHAPRAGRSYSCMSMLADRVPPRMDAHRGARRAAARGPRGPRVSWQCRSPAGSIARAATRCDAPPRARARPAAPPYVPRHCDDRRCASVRR